MSEPRTICITGVTGLVGDGIARWFLARGDRVIGTVRRDVTSRHPGLRVVPCDLRSCDPRAIGPLLAGCDAIVHTAAIIPKGRTTWTYADASELFAVNALGTRALLEAAASVGVPRFVLLSGTRLAEIVDGDAHADMSFATQDPYSTSKLCAELMCREYQNSGRMRTTTLRISAPYGYVLTGDAVITRFIRSALRGNPITLWGSGRREQVFTFVDDIARACDLAISAGVDGIFTITSGETRTMRELAEAVLRSFPDTRAAIAVTGQPDPGEGRRVQVAPDAAHERLGYTPAFDLDQGLAAIARHLTASSAARAILMEESVTVGV